MRTLGQRKSEKGATLTELIILTPIPLTPILGAIDLGRPVFARQVLTDLSREAANLVSRGATAQQAFATTLRAGRAFDLATSGGIIISRVRRRAPTNARAWVVEQETHGSAGGFVSRIGQLGAPADIPKMTNVAPGVTVTAVEIFHRFEPVFAFSSLGLDIYPEFLYDAASFWNGVCADHDRSEDRTHDQVDTREKERAGRRPRAVSARQRHHLLRHRAVHRSRRGVRATRHAEQGRRRRLPGGCAPHVEGRRGLEEDREKGRAGQLRHRDGGRNRRRQLQGQGHTPRHPLDLSLVLDLSASLKRNNAFDDMQAAARGFLQNFDDNIDQCGIVTYSTWGEERMPLRKNFTSTGVSIIDGLFAISDTNIQEGLRVAKAQFDAATPRETAIKVLELFTDGRPTALADNFWTDGATDTCAADTTGAATGALRFSPTGDSGTGLLGSALGAAPGSTSSGAGVDSDGDGTPDCYAGVVACYISGNSYRGLFRQSTGQKVAEFRSNGTIRYVANGSTASSPKPNRLPDGSVVNGKNIRRLGVEYAEIWANEDGVVNASQPQGAMLFAPTPADLEDTFTKLADRILTRLTR